MIKFSWIKYCPPPPPPIKNTALNTKAMQYSFTSMHVYSIPSCIYTYSNISERVSPVFGPHTTNSLLWILIIQSVHGNCNKRIYFRALHGLVMWTRRYWSPHEVHTQNFSLERGADPEAIYNLCFILKIMLLIYCHKYNRNVTPFATACISVQIQLHVSWCTCLTLTTMFNLFGVF
jgi:hypothetical protein